MRYWMRVNVSTATTRTTIRGRCTAKERRMRLIEVPIPARWKIVFMGVLGVLSALPDTISTC